MKKYQSVGKRILGMILSVVLIAGSVDMTAFATVSGNELPVVSEPVVNNAAVVNNYGTVVESGTCGATESDSITWTIYDSGEDEDEETLTGDVLVISGTGKMADFPQDSTPWASYVSSIKTVKISDGVTYIGNLAFYGCGNLIDIEIPNSVTGMGYCVFEDCSSLSSIELPDGITSIGYSAFSGCSSLRSIELPEGLASISTYAFQDCTELKSITIPGSVTFMDIYVFKGCTGLESVILEEGITSIGDRVFYELADLKSVTLPQSIDSIGKYAFVDCGSLTEINLPSELSNIGERSFQNCTGLESIIIPGTVTNIGERAFCNTGLKSVTLLEGASGIGDYVFQSCENLETVYIPKSITTMGTKPFYNVPSTVKFYLESSAVYGEETDFGGSGVAPILPYRITCVQEETETLIEEVNADGVQSYTFDENNLPETDGLWFITGTGQVVAAGTTLENIEADVTLEETGVSVGADILVFSGYEEMPQLSAEVWTDTPLAITYQWQEAKVTDGTIGEYADIVGATEATYSIPLGKEAGKYSYRVAVLSGESVIGYSKAAMFTVIDGTFVAGGTCGATGDDDVNWMVYDSGADGDEDSLTGDVLVISGTGAMTDYDDWYGAPWVQYKESLKKVEIDAGVTHIGQYTMNSCVNLIDVVVPDSVTSIGENAFRECSSLTGIELPTGITTLDAAAFMDCSKLESIKVPAGVTSLNSVFYGCSSLGSVELPNGLTSIEVYTFKDCSSLSGIELPDGLNTIEMYAFDGCTGLKSITIPGSVTSLDMYVFDGCTGLESIIIEEGLTNIGDVAFYGLTGLKSVTLPQSVETIGMYVFRDCSSLTEINLPDGITGIGSEAFLNCSSLTEVKLPNNLTSIEYGLFNGCSNLQTVYIPKAVNYMSNSGFKGVSENVKLYLESSEYFGESTDLGGSGVAPILPYRIAYMQDGVETVIEEVYADGKQGYTFAEGDLPETDGTWCDNATKKPVDTNVGVILENISANIILEEVAASITGQPQDATGAYGLTPQLSVTVQTVEGTSAAYQWQEAVVTESGVGEYADVEGATEASYTVPANKSVGTYSYRCVVTYNGYILTSDAATVTLNPAVLTITDAEIADKDYDGEKDAEITTLSFNGLVNDETLTADVDYTAVAEFADAVAGEDKEVTVTVTLEEGSNYQLEENTYTTTATISKVDCEVVNRQTPDGYVTTYIYNGTNLIAPTAEQFRHNNTDEDAEITFSWYKGDYTASGAAPAESDKLTTTPRNAGTYTLVAKVAETDNYNMAETAVKVEILKKAVTVTADDKSKKYLEENPELTFTVAEGTLEGEDTKEALGVTLTTEATKESLAGTYAIAGTADSENYDVTVIPGTLTVGQANAVVIIPEDKQHYIKTYGDEGFKIEVSTNGDGVLTYTLTNGKSLDGEVKAESDILHVAEDGTATIVGTGTVTVLIATKATAEYMAAEPKTVTVQINRYDGFMVDTIADETYTGKAICPEVRVYDGESEKVLVKGRDYTVTYKNNVNASVEVTDAAKMPTVLVKGKGNYSKQIAITFNILPKNINDGDVTAPALVVEENGNVQKKAPVLTCNKKKLKANKDVVITYPDTAENAYKAAGTYTIHVAGKGNYTGERNITLTITEKGYLLSKATIQKIPAQNLADYGGAVVLDSKALVVTSKIDGKKVTLVEGQDFKAAYENNNKAGKATVTITGMGKFSGTKKATFTINGISIVKAKVDGLEPQVYNGKAQEPKVTVTLSTGEILSEKDYTVEYTKNTAVGTASVIVKGCGIYSGSIKKSFKITPYDLTGETDVAGTIKEGSPVTEANGLLSKADGALHVKYVKSGVKPEVELYFAGTLMKVGKDYTISYANNKAVTTETTKKLPTITIKGKGNFTGKFAKAFTIDAKDLSDGVAMTVNDKAVSKKAGGYISKPVLTDTDGKVLKQGKDYTKPVYTTVRENGEIITLDNKSKVEAGKVITITVQGMGNYTDKALSVTYRITDKNFGSIKAASIIKVYNGSKVMLTKSDFYKEDGSSKITFKQGKETISLEYGVDFEIVKGSYKKSDKTGTATVTLRGLGEYGGIKTIKFKIMTKELYKK